MTQCQIYMSVPEAKEEDRDERPAIMLAHEGGTVTAHSHLQLVGTWRLIQLDVDDPLTGNKINVVGDLEDVRYPDQNTPVEAHEALCRIYISATLLGRRMPCLMVRPQHGKASAHGPVLILTGTWDVFQENDLDALTATYVTLRGNMNDGLDFPNGDRPPPTRPMRGRRRL